MNVQPKVFISTPCYGGVCLEKYMISIVKLQLEFIREGIQMVLDTTENESLVHRARNVAVGRFMQKSDASHFVFIDADIDFDPKSDTKNESQQERLCFCRSPLFHPTKIIYSYFSPTF